MGMARALARALAAVPEARQQVLQRTRRWA